MYFHTGCQPTDVVSKHLFFSFLLLFRPQIPSSDELCHILTIHRSATPPESPPTPPLNLSQSPPDLQPPDPLPHSIPITVVSSHRALSSPDTPSSLITPSLGLPSVLSTTPPTPQDPSNQLTPPQALSPPPPDFSPPPAELLGSDDEEQENPSDYCKGRIIIRNPFLIDIFYITSSKDTYWSYI